MRRRPIWPIVGLLLASLLLGACATQGAAPTAAQEEKVQIGLLLDSLLDERWQRDRDIFVARARELGADVRVQAAGGDDYLQIAQAENMISHGVDVLVIVPHDASAVAPVVEMAHQAGVKVIAYDRMINWADVDFYLSFDSERVGELQAEYLVRLLPKGNYVYIGGAPTDNNSYLLQRGALNILEPYLQRGEIRLIFDDMTPEWRPEAARRLMEAAIMTADGQIDAVIAANDGTAGGVIEALTAAGLAGRVAVTGQDAELAAIRRIMAGTQSMTVYKPIRLLATQAAEVAVQMAKGQLPEAQVQVHNGKRAIPSILIEPMAVDSTTLWETVIADGFHRESDLVESH